MKDRQILTQAIRALTIDAIEKSNSGHPGMPMGMAEVAETLWRHHLSHNPNNPTWFNRDRFVISNGHGSMLLYALLHLTGYDLSIEEIKNFRQLGSKTPGHPEYGHTKGVETTTGPLGQGLSNAIGMAIAEKSLSAEFNKPDCSVINHHTYVFLGDGCLMEGVSHEASSLAGVLGLGKLVAIYDDNGISIDSDKGNIKQWLKDDTAARFQAYGWHVIDKVDGHSFVEIDRALRDAKQNADQPTLICCKTTIGKGSPNKQGTGSVHGAPLGEEEARLAKKELNWNYPPFEIPAEIYKGWDCRAKGEERQRRWNKNLELYKKNYPESFKELIRRMDGKLPEDWIEQKHRVMAETLSNRKAIATRKASENMINRLSRYLPELLGGSADLAASNLTMHANAKPMVKGTKNGDYIFYGVREFGMSSIMNGIALYGGLIPFGGTFLVFSDYSRNALRMGALMGVRVIHIFTHDSIGLGEDGPTHQPIEHAASLRLIPNMDVWRPCDDYETAVAWFSSVERHDGPSSILLSRQTLPPQIMTNDSFNSVSKGGYTLVDSPNPSAVILATGSEVALAVDAQKLLSQKGVAVSVVSMPSTTVFDRQDRDYKHLILPDGIPKIAIEAGVSDFWWKYTGAKGDVLGIDQFGESAPGKDLFQHFGLTVQNLVKRVEKLL